MPGLHAFEARCRDVLLTSDEGRRHVAFFAAIPDDLIPWMAPFWWNLDRLLALDLPIAQQQMSELRQFLAVRYWRAGQRSGLFHVNAWDVLAHPEIHADHWQRTMDTNLCYPLTGYRMHDRLILLDGYHRLLKAEATGVESLPIVTVPESKIDGVLIREGFLGELNAMRDVWPTRTSEFVLTLRRVARAIQREYPAGTFPDW
ncbi:MAG: hypothetical protein QM753_02845 [Thermomicrobiales bacterium]